MQKLRAERKRSKSNYQKAVLYSIKKQKGKIEITEREDLY